MCYYLNGDIMNEEKQIVLFFRKGIVVNGPELALKLSNKFSFLGSPTVIPYNPKDVLQPLVIFNQGMIEFTATASDINIVYKKKDHEQIYDDIMSVIEFLEELDYSFDRMGYITTFLHSKKEKENFMKNVFKDQDLINSEFQLSWYKKELIDSVLVNVWEREMTDLMNGVMLLSVFDINTPIDEQYNISSEFLRDFLKKCDRYVENSDKKLK